MTSSRSGAGTDSALAAIVLSSQDAVIAKTVDGVVTSWNDGATELYGYRAAEMIGRDIEITIPLEDRSAERTRHLRVARGNAESGYRCVRVDADGRRIQVVMSMSPVRNRAGDVVGIASISRPVSSEEAAQARFSS
ncbi:MAG: PAS domain-containing protein [Cellulomonas sp.]